jgi:hypothetical protein
VLLASGSAWGQNAETRARGLNRDAMETDYLATNMKAAAAKLQTALRVCQKGRCSNNLLAQIYVNLGTVYAAGLNQHTQAVEAFKQALSLEPSVTPDPNYLTDAVQKDFDEAKGGGGTKEEPTERPLAELTEKPFSEQAIRTPVPVFVEVPAGVEAARVVVRYKAPGQASFTDLTLKAHAKGFGEYIPCSAVETAGKLEYFVTALDKKGDPVASAGSATEPRTVELKNAISGDRPALPGSPPPSPCAADVAAASCQTDDDCAEGQACQDSACVDKTEGSEGEAHERKLNWLGVVVSPDFMFIQEKTDACSVAAQSDSNVSCYYADGTRYDRTLAPVQGTANTLSSGIAPVGTLHLLLMYERVLAKRMVLGVRAGYTLFGVPEDFVPIHAEARFAFHLSNDPFARPGVRPYVFVGAGFGPASGRVPVEVVDATAGKQKLDAYQEGGPAFVALGPGLQYGLGPNLALVLELSAKAMIPDFALVIAPYLGAAYGF